MIQYYDELLDDEKEELQDVIKTLYHQTFLLEKRYDKKTSRYVVNPEYRVCERHLDFLKEYFEIGGLSLMENRQFGIMALQTTMLQGEKLSKLTTIFVILLKVIFDEKMATVSNSVHVFTSLEEIYSKIQLFNLWGNRSIAITEVRKTIGVLRKYQIIEAIDVTGELPGDTRILIYPTVNLLFQGAELMKIIEQYQNQEEELIEEDRQIMIQDDMDTIGEE